MNINNMQFSFVLPAYKKQYLFSAINSIINQTYSDFELVIVDDDSPENLEEVINQFKDSRIRYYKNEQNIGKQNLVQQWNKCLSYAQGEYVILASDDDVYHPDFLSTFVPLIKKYPQVNLFRARSLTIDKNDKIINDDKYYKEFIHPIEFRYIWFKRIKGGIANYIFKKEILVNIGGFVEFPLAWYSDDATILLMSANGVVNSAEYLFSFRMSGINISSKKNDLQEKLKANVMMNTWMKSYLYINSTDDLTMFYQQKIKESYEGRRYYDLHFLLNGMCLKQFISSSMYIIINEHTLPKKQKIKLIRSVILNKFINPISNISHKLYGTIIK